MTSRTVSDLHHLLHLPPRFLLSFFDSSRSHIQKGTNLGKEAKAFIDRGDLVPDQVMVGLIASELKALGAKPWLLDGFPRTLAQAEALQVSQ